MLRWLRENTSTPFLKRHGVAPVEGQSLAAAAKKSRLEDLLDVYDKAACDLSCLVVRRSEATIAAEREEDRREREEEERQFGLGKAQDPEAADSGGGGGGGGGGGEGGPEDEADAARQARLDQLNTDTLQPEPEPEGTTGSGPDPAAVAAASMEMELAYRYSSEEKPSAIREKLLGMTEFERGAALDRCASLLWYLSWHLLVVVKWLPDL